jgi:hypothetical protein
MNDLAKWKVHGPVATLRTENAEWDTDRKDWKLARYFTLTSFRRAGTVDSSETHNPGGSIGHSRWLYDSAGRLTESESWMDDSPPQRVLYFYDEAGRHVRTAQLRADAARPTSKPAPTTPMANKPKSASCRSPRKAEPETEPHPSATASKTRT